MWLPDFNLIRIDLDIEGLVQAMLLEDFTMAGSRVSIGNDPQRDVLLLAFGHEFADTGSSSCPEIKRFCCYTNSAACVARSSRGPSDRSETIKSAITSR